MPTYLTWEKVRQRYVFQMRIPDYARDAFGGRSTIRVHLGDIAEADAHARASQLAAHYKALFERHRKSKKRRKVAEDVSIRFILDTDMQQRVVSTWRAREADRIECRIDALLEASDAAWADMEAETEAALSEAREALRRRLPEGMHAALQSIQTEFNVKFEGDQTALDTLTHEFNGERVTFLNDCLAVIRGEKPVSCLHPEPESQLPLISLWGDPAHRLAEHWRERVIATGGHVNPKTFDKFNSIAADLGAILIRRPVQSLNQADLLALTKLWQSRKNGAETIKDKLSILLSLIRPFDPDNRLEPLFTRIPRSARSHRATRIPFSEDQISQFLAHIVGNPKVREDDQILVVLMILTGARLEELYQLRTNDITSDREGWLVRIADHRQTGSGNSRLKNDVSARRLPLCRGTYPNLDAWLTDRLETGGYLFPDGSNNKYGIRSDAASKRLNRILRSMFPDDRRLVLQSTRSTANRVMRRADTDTRIRHRFLGHADTGIHDRHYDPGELLDDQDLESGSAALADFLLGVLRIERGGSV